MSQTRSIWKELSPADELPHSEPEEKICEPHRRKKIPPFTESFIELLRVGLVEIQVEVIHSSEQKVSAPSLQPQLLLSIPLSIVLSVQIPLTVAPPPEKILLLFVSLCLLESLQVPLQVQVLLQVPLQVSSLEQEENGVQPFLQRCV